MKIAFFVTGFPKLSETFILNQIIGLIDKGHDVTILSFEKEYGISHDLISKYDLLSRTVYLLPVSENKWVKAAKLLAFGMVGFLKKPAMPSNLDRESINHFAALGKNAFLGKFDVVIAHFGPVGVQASNLRNDGLFTGKLATVFHGYDISRYQVVADYEARYKTLFSEGELFLPISHLWADKLKQLGCPSEKVVLHRMGVDSNSFSWIEGYKPPEHDAPVRFLSVARLAPKKGIDTAIEALGELHKQGIDFSYRVIGSGDQLPGYKKRSEELDISDKIVFLGNQTQSTIRDEMEHAHFFLLPSKTSFDGDMEGIPVALMEAMCLGLPVISSTHSGIPELIEHRRSGFLAREADAESLSQTIREALSYSAEDMLDIRNNAREKVNLEFDKFKLIDELESILRNETTL
ncbi:glycosyltransferase [Larsenimonas salina]|uniref:glycosyltransferase n=1 Tax=Larsenimonas salina TaxID=1295565 RepID=UPI0020747C1E|nr:glycosyltransferase [Larsenimonas salina]MCM5703666.1 glycosyltransferase [Larsenimonas salina]